MADQKRKSVAEILAACRRLDGAPSAAAESPAAEAAPPAKPTPPAATAKPPASAAGGRPSVAEMLAAARAEKAASAAETSAPVKPAPEKAAPAKPAAAEAKAAPKPTPAAPSGPKDTASVLAAARGAKKPGPITKAEAAAGGEAPARGAAKEALVLPPMPVKPAYAKRPDKPVVVNEGRRAALLSILVGSFLALGFTSLAATMSLWTLGLARFMFPNILREPPSQFKVGFPAAFAPGTVETKFIPQFGVWVVNTEYDGQPQIFALKSVCTHLGCTPNWLEAEQKFKCPCHGSGFYKDGINFEGPAPRPLERYAIAIADDGQLQVDKSKTFQQEMGGWEDAASFVPV